jgi:hypothetical protein
MVERFNDFEMLIPYNNWTPINWKSETGQSIVRRDVGSYIQNWVCSSPIGYGTRLTCPDDPCFAGWYKCILNVAWITANGNGIRHIGIRLNGSGSGGSNSAANNNGLFFTGEYDIAQAETTVDAALAVTAAAAAAVAAEAAAVSAVYASLVVGAPAGDPKYDAAVLAQAKALLALAAAITASNAANAAAAALVGTPAAVAAYLAAVAASNYLALANASWAYAQATVADPAGAAATAAAAALSAANSAAAASTAAAASSAAALAAAQAAARQNQQIYVREIYLRPGDYIQGMAFHSVVGTNLAVSGSLSLRWVGGDDPNTVGGSVYGSRNRAYPVPLPRSGNCP